MENNITDTEKLKTEIRILKDKLECQEKELKSEMREIKHHVPDESQSTTKELVAADLKKMAVTAIVSLAAGYLSKKIVIGSTRNPVKILVGELFQVGVTGMVAKMMNSKK